MRKWYNNQAAAKTAAKNITNSGQKIFKRNFKKGIDKVKKMWYNNQARAKASDWNLTIEQQKIEVQSKFSKCEYKICQNQREKYNS